MTYWDVWGIVNAATFLVVLVLLFAKSLFAKNNDGGTVLFLMLGLVVSSSVLAAQIWFAL